MLQTKRKEDGVRVRKNYSNYLDLMLFKHLLYPILITYTYNKIDNYFFSYHTTDLKYDSILYYHPSAKICLFYILLYTF